MVRSNPFDSLIAISTPALDDVWAVGSHNSRGRILPLVDRWDGNSWRAVAAPHIHSGEGGALTGVAALSADDVWVVGGVDHGYRFTSAFLAHWDGAAWTAMTAALPKAPDTRFDSIVAVARDDIWAIGTFASTTFDTSLGFDRHQHLFADHWDGKTWALVAVPLKEVFIRAPHVVATSTNDVWLVADADAGPGFDYGAAAHWDGTRWQVVAVPAGGGCAHGEDLIGMSTVAADDVWAICGEGMFHWDGTHWARVAGPSPVVAEDIAATTTGEVFVVGTDGGDNHALIESWNGARWKLAASFTRAPRFGGFSGFHAVAIAASDEVWAVGDLVAHRSCG